MSRGVRRGGGSPRLRTPNRMGSTGTAMAGQRMHADTGRSRAATGVEHEYVLADHDIDPARRGRRRRAPRPASWSAQSRLGDEFLHLAAQLIERQFDWSGTNPDHQDPWRKRLATIDLAKDLPQATTQPVALDRRAVGAPDRVRHEGRFRLRLRTPAAPQGRSPDSAPVTRKCRKCVTAVNPLDQTDRRARPLARRLLRTARPPRVLMRARNPCFLARRWLLG